LNPRNSEGYSSGSNRPPALNSRKIADPGIDTDKSGFSTALSAPERIL
jgi:hypothetical protein